MLFTPFTPLIVQLRNFRHMHNLRHLHSKPTQVRGIRYVPDLPQYTYMLTVEVLY